MKRSQINTILRDIDGFIRQQQFHLPPFAHWTPEDWSRRGAEAAEIATHRLGWDVTDFGRGDYENFGLALFTIRNGSPQNLIACSGKLYAEKLLIIDNHQMNPLHFHWQKTEDIINRGGGTLLIKLYKSTADEGVDDLSEITVSTDGVARTIPAGGIVALKHGESITLPTGLYHNFWTEDGRVLIGEVSMVNDDLSDNRFVEPLGRFPTIEEDEPPLYLLCGDYAKYYHPNAFM